jgi:hypothetical protein
MTDVGGGVRTRLAPRHPGQTPLWWSSAPGVGHDSQLCASGGLTWTADRVIPPTETTPPTVPDGVGVLKLRIRHRVAEVVKLSES